MPANLEKTVKRPDFEPQLGIIEPPDAEMDAKPTDQDILTAYHEAGHAVMALIVGRDVHRVSILPNQTRLGACELKKGRSKPSRDMLEDEVLILLAGVAAEGRLTENYNWSGGSQDLRQAQYLIESRAGNQRQSERLHRRMLDKAEYLLDDSAHWGAVQVIANQLLELKTISGRAARHFYNMQLAKKDR